MAKMIRVGRNQRSAPSKAELPGNSQKIADLLTMPGTEHLEIEIPHFEDRARPADLS